MKKIFSTLIASIMSVSVLTAVSVSAASATEVNALAVSTETIATATTVNGTSIPAGTVAITVSISNNSGFSSSSVKLDLGSAYDVVLDSEGKLIVSAGIALGESLIGSHNNEDIVVITSASADENIANGEMFTFYAYTDESLSDNSVSILESEITEYISIEDAGISPCGSAANFYYRGDVNDDDIVGASDAALVLAALDDLGLSYLTYDEVSAWPEFYFPYIYVADAAFIWSDYRNIDSTTAEIILEYYACRQAGENYTRPTGCVVGIPVRVNN